MRSSILLSVLVFGACQGAPASTTDALRVEVVSAGDTTVVRSSGTPVLLRPDTTIVLWRSDSLERPSSMARSGDRLVVGDRTMVHLVPITGGPVVSSGGEGEAPGEFRSIASVGVRGDTVLAYDPRVMRLSRLGADGTYLSSSRITPAMPFVNSARQGHALVVRDNALLWFRDENVSLQRPVRRALVRHDMEGDSARVLRSWPNGAWRRLGNLIGYRELFPERAVVAVAQDGRIAYGSGLDYCISVFRVNDAAVRRVCREWERVPVGDGIRSPDLDRVEDERSREVLRALVDEQEIGELLPSFDMIRFGAGGTLWVRTLGEEMRNVHPYAAHQIDDLAPESRRWDVFDDEGQLSLTVELPTAFDPRVFQRDRIWGILELPSGELTIGEVRFAAAASFTSRARD